jgi:hypothetical protein
VQIRLAERCLVYNISHPPIIFKHVLRRCISMTRGMAADPTRD